jgi:hypothetical protein
MKGLLIVVAAVAAGVATASMATAAPPATWVTSVRFDCDRGWTGGNGITLTRDGAPLATRPLECADGSSTGRVEIVTEVEPNDWHILGGFAMGPDIVGLCAADSGTTFPVQYECSGTRLFVGHPHPGT